MRVRDAVMFKGPDKLARGVCQRGLPTQVVACTDAAILGEEKQRTVTAGVLAVPLSPVRAAVVDDDDAGNAAGLIPDSREDVRECRHGVVGEDDGRNEGIATRGRLRAATWHVHGRR